MNLDQELLEILACPACKSALRVDDGANELICVSGACGLAYPVRDDIPVLLVDEARKPGEKPSEAGASESGPSGSSSSDDATAE